MMPLNQVAIQTNAESQAVYVAVRNAINGTMVVRSGRAVDVVVYGAVHRAVNWDVNRALNWAVDDDTCRAVHKKGGVFRF